ncbi:hypothetical protein M2436_007549 [Streptomyces sp. HB372]|nr:hypothetical protein [Streptomyces sp. HB372]
MCAVAEPRARSGPLGLKVYADGPCENTIVRYTPAA